MLKDLEKAIYNEFDFKVYIEEDYNKEGNFSYLYFKIPSEFDLFRKYIIRFSSRYIAHLGLSEKYVCCNLKNNFN